MTTIDGSLENWVDVRRDGDWPTLILGNGASMSVWPDFGYDSLFEKATLSDEARLVFEHVGTNFEAALEYIHHAKVVLQALGLSVDETIALYGGVRDGLFNAVNEVHMDWSWMDDYRAVAIAEEVNQHSSVFTTNYDLLLYWAIMKSERAQGTTDLFSGQDELRFNPGLFARTTFYYLHGAIHLWQDDEGRNGKWANRDGRSLRQIVSRYSPDSDVRPLFVSEGTSEEKLRTIRRSPYLSHCLDRLASDISDAVVFGNSLSLQDEHIRDALKNRPRAGRRIAFSVLPSIDEAVAHRKAELCDQFRGFNLRFFDASTHPLGDISLRVTLASFGTFPSART
ncbi:DUF4917 family protein [Isoptericola aurantiacus]|uniref:DUF4917 family protein n=1 Tax=Isoptericola aurantiacus TaxID=3377839 RepID=UPI00383A9B30